MRTHSRRVTVLVSALLATPVAARAQSTVNGWTYAMNITTDSGLGAAKRGSIALRYQTSPTALRMEIMQVGGSANDVMHGASIEGMYTLIKDADSTYTTVMPPQHAAMVMMNPIYAFTNVKSPTVESRPTVQSIEDLGAGEKILGHPTHHYRYTMSGPMRITMNGQTCTMPSDGQSEVWIAPDVDIGPAMRSTASHYGFEPPDSIAADHTSMRTKGVALRTIGRTTVTSSSGESRVISTTTEFVELSQGTLDASLFTVPADYKVMDMRKMAAQMSGIIDSISTARAKAPGGGCPH